MVSSQPRSFDEPKKLVVINIDIIIIINVLVVTKRKKVKEG